MEKRKILLVEDEVRFQKAIAKFFESEGFAVFSAYDGEAGLILAEQENPDIILLDLILPKKNGFEVLEKIKSTPGLSKIPVVILTNLEGVQDVERATSLGASAFLIKANYSLDDLASKVKELLEGVDKK